MSYIITNRIRSLPVPQPAKMVLWVLADIANDEGETLFYASIPKLMTESSYKKDAVINAIKYLELVGLVWADRSNGRQTAYIVTPDNYDPSCKVAFNKRGQPVLFDAKPVGQPDGLEENQDDQNTGNQSGSTPEAVGQPDQSGETTSRAARKTSRAAPPDQSGSTPQPVGQPDSIHIYHHNHHNHQAADGENPVEKKPARKRKSEPTPNFDAKKIDLPENVSRENWIAYIEMRVSKKKPPTEYACKLVLKVLLNLGAQANASLEKSIVEGWTDVYPVKSQEHTVHIARNGEQENVASSLHQHGYSNINPETYQPAKAFVAPEQEQLSPEEMAAQQAKKQQLLNDLRNQS